MKRPWLEDLLMISILVAITLFMTACSGGSGGAQESGPAAPAFSCATLAGTYIEDFSGSILVIAGDCTFTDSYCGYSANYSVPTANPYDATVTVNGTNGAAGCMSSTAHTCQLGWDQNDLGVVCDGGNYTYLFHKQ